MQTLTRQSLTPPSTSRLRWTFLRGTRAITCELRLGPRSWQVHLIPGWDVRSAHVESSSTAMAALWRHAEIAKQLRESGWSLVSRSLS